MGRARTRERRRERQQQQRRQRQLAVLGALAALAVIAVLVIVLVNQPAEAPIPDGSQERYVGIPQDLTEDGYPILGDPNAPVQLVEYSSFDCPHCQEFHEGVVPNLVDRVRAGEMSFTYVPIFGTGAVTNGEGAAKAAVCAAQQGAFWPYHDALFTWQVLYGNTAFSQSRLASGIENLGLNRAEWEQCLRSDLPDRVVLSPTEAADAVPNFTGTPLVVVNGTVAPVDLEGLNAAIDQALALASPLQIEPTAQPEATDEATAEVTPETTQAP